MFFRKVVVENWKNFKRGAASLRRRTFLIGPNASGKSNFLDVLRFLRDLAAVSGGGLRQAVESRHGVSAIRCLAARKYPDVMVEVELQENGDANAFWRYRLKFNQDNLQRPTIKEELVERNREVLLRRPEKSDEDDSLRLTQTALEQITANAKFRPIVSFFQSVSYQHLLPQVVRDPQGFSPGSIENDPFGRDFLQRVENTAPKVRDSRLRKITKVLQVAAPQLKDLEVTRDKFGIPHLVGLFEHWRPHAGKQQEAQFSDGTLRLFGLLWSLFEGDGALLMEEPELSLHDEIVCRLPSLIEKVNRYRKIRRQVIISTHSAAMLRDPGIDGNEIIRLEPSSEGTLLVSPADNPEERALLESGLPAGDVVFAKSAPLNVRQLEFSFEK